MEGGTMRDLGDVQLCMSPREHYYIIIIINIVDTGHRGIIGIIPKTIVAIYIYIQKIAFKNPKYALGKKKFFNFFE